MNGDNYRYRRCLVSLLRCSLSRLHHQVLQESAGVESTAAITGVVKGRSHSSGDAGEIAYKTFLGHLYDVLEEKINNDRYDEGVRQLVGNQVRESAQGRFMCLLGHSGTIELCFVRVRCLATWKPKYLNTLSKRIPVYPMKVHRLQEA